MGAKTLALAAIAGSAAVLYYFRGILPGIVTSAILFAAGFFAVWFSLRGR